MLDLWNIGGDLRRAALALVVVLAACPLGCSSDYENLAPRESTEAGPERAVADDPIEVATRLARSDATLSRMLAPNPDGWQRDGEWVTSPAWRAAEHKRFEGVGARLPERADQVREVGLSRFERFRLRMTAEGANPDSVLELHEGRAVYRDVWPSTDVVITVTEHRYEEFLVLKDERAPREFVWGVKVPGGLHIPLDEVGTGIRFEDSMNRTVLNMPSPIAKGIQNRDVSVASHWESGRLTVSVQGTNTTQILLDPAVESTIWERASTPANKPPAREDHAVAYDIARAKTVLYGGKDAFDQLLGDTWEWDGVTWSERSPANNPPALTGHALAYDDYRQRVVLFGGWDGGTSGASADTWEWDGEDWQKRDASPVPLGRTSFGMAFDGNRTLVYGGPTADSAGANDLWEWDGTVWEEQSPPTLPAGARDPELFCLQGQGECYIFGGYPLYPSAFTWAWNGTQWAEVATPEEGPPPREGHAMAANTIRGRGVLYGGSGSFGLRDTWEWDGSRWVETSRGPPSLVEHAMAFDSARGEVVLFGGTNLDAGGYPVQQDTWLYSAYGGACTADTECDTGVCVDGVCCQAGCGTCEACDTVASPGVCSPVINAQDPDTCTGANTCGPNGDCGLPNGETCSNASQCASRFCVDGFCCDTACSGSCDACNGATRGWSGAVNGTCAIAPLSFAGAPACTPYACDSAHADCPVSCPSDMECATSHYCSLNGTCQPRRAVSSSCDLTADCMMSGCRECVAGATCKDGYCCESGCSGACQTCSANPGTCTPVASADDPDTCFLTRTCSAGGVCGLKNGAPCAGGGACASGFCADGRCCNSACTGGCNVCDATPGTCTVVGSGNPGANPACNPYVCSGAATCPSSCTSDANCASGFYCSANGACVPQKAQGATCNDAGGADCRVGGCRVCPAGEGTCVDGFCCNTACSGACDACDGALRGWAGAVNGTCALAPEGSAGTPACGAYACTGSDPGCVGAACDADGDCGGAFYCDKNGQCQPRRTQGQLCNDGAGADCLAAGCRVCTSGHCSDGVCCDTACGGGCDACKESAGAASDGVCSVLPTGATGTGCGALLCDGMSGLCPAEGSCTSDDECAPNTFCNEQGSCEARRLKGEPCTESSQCAQPDPSRSGFGYCVDGFCCDLECNNGCSACAAALKANGQGDGACGPARAGTDPHGTCEAEPQSSCGRTGSCDGEGGCQLWPEKTPCGATFCTLANVTGQVCSGNGTCVDVTTVPCSPYLCQNDACTSPCESSAHCDVDYHCAAGACVKRQDNGRSCALADECASGFCVDGVCCDSPCGGQCEACAQSGNVGKCVAVDGPPVTPRPACAGEPPCKGICDGGDRTACAYPDQATSCGSAACEGDVLQQDPRCDGAGACAPARTQSCVPYACAGEACNDTCATDSDCAAGAACDGEGRCAIVANTCKDAFTVVSPSLEETSCLPYRCAAGACRGECSAAADCAPGFACASGECELALADAGGALPRPDAGMPASEAGAVGAADAAPQAADAGATATRANEAGGCGCRTHRSTSSSSGALLFALAGLASLRRRRNRRSRPAACRVAPDKADTVDTPAPASIPASIRTGALFSERTEDPRPCGAENPVRVRWNGTCTVGGMRKNLKNQSILLFAVMVAVSSGACSGGDGAGDGISRSGLDCADGLFYWDGGEFDDCRQCPDYDSCGFATTTEYAYPGGRQVVTSQSVTAHCSGQSVTILNGQCQRADPEDPSNVVSSCDPALIADGVCDEPNGTDLCAAGSDPDDCSGTEALIDRCGVLCEQITARACPADDPSACRETCAAGLADPRPACRAQWLIPFECGATDDEKTCGDDGHSIISESCNDAFMQYFDDCP